MNTLHQTNDLKKGHCRSVYYLGGRKVENTYKCNQRSFSQTKLWSIHRSKRDKSTSLTALETVL